MFQKIQQTLFWGHLDLFCPNLVENELSRKKGLCRSLNIQIIYHRAKNQKKTDRWTDRQTN